MRCIVLFVSCVGWLPLLHAVAPPRLLFSDLESGPKTGGEGDGGAYVTVYGKDFGANHDGSYVTVGGGRISTYPIWTDTKITFQLGATAATGDIVVTTPGGSSNGIPFTVRGGNIYFVALNGSDGNNGSRRSPWRTVLKARDTIKPGDVVYAMNGVGQTTDDGQGWAAAFTLRNDWCGGNTPRALVAYPGATVTIGDVNSPAFAIRSVDSSAGGGPCTGSWLFAGLVLRGQVAFNLWGPSTHWRIVGNDVSCPNGDGASACVATALASGITILGNNVHDSGRANASALYQGVYLGTDTNNAELGWNMISNVRGCRGVQVYSHPLGSASPDTGRNQFGIIIHDNIIHDTQCDGIVFYTVDPSRGKVEAYNNVIYNAGLGNTPERTGNWSCINVVGATNYGPAGGGTVEIYQNTLYNCGTNPAPPYAGSVNAIEYGGGNPNLRVRIQNNIIYQPHGVPYLSLFGTSNGMVGSNNLFFGNGPAPSNPNIIQSLNRDPLFVNDSRHDFHLGPGSPGCAAEKEAATDQESVHRGGRSNRDLGALPCRDKH